MKKPLFLLACAALSLGLSTPAFADNEQKIDHYEGQEFTSARQALTTIEVKTAAIQNILKNKELTSSNIEAIHEITYTIEDAVALAAQHSKFDFTKLSAALENVHLSSENHNSDKLKEHFAAYAPEVKKLLAAQ